MKHFATFICAITFTFFGLTLQGQHAKKMLVEKFTNTRCSICASRVPQLNQNMQGFEDNIQLISYFTASPANCELHHAYREGNQSRIQHYGVGGSPTVFVNGERVNVGSSIVPIDYFEERKDDLSPLHIEILMSLQDSLADVSVALTFDGEVPDGDLRLHAMIVEKHVVAGPISHYRNHSNVLRGHLTPLEGWALTGLQEGQTTLFEFDFKVQPNWNVEEVAIVAFVQDAETNEIWNAGESIQEATSSLNEMPGAMQVVVYPNPVGYMLHIKGDIATCPGAHAAIYGADGRLCRLVKNEELTSCMLNVEQLEAGTYFLKINGSNCSCVRTFIIAR